MKSSAATVGEYVAQVEEAWSSVVERLRAACQEHLHGYDEVMAYGMPTYQFGGLSEVAFAKQVSKVEPSSGLAGASEDCATRSPVTAVGCGRERR
jgi:uncharacterized protein YdhG (YjbR/CyaY superfamily)